jgi:hypothetical protein
MGEDRRYDELGNGVERRAHGGLTPAQFAELKEFVRELVKELIADIDERVKKKVLASLFEDVGRGTVTKVLSAFGYLVILVFIGVLAFWIGKEHINLH